MTTTPGEPRQQHHHQQAAQNQGESIYKYIDYQDADTYHNTARIDIKKDESQCENRLADNANLQEKK